MRANHHATAFCDVHQFGAAAWRNRQAATGRVAESDSASAERSATHQFREGAAHGLGFQEEIGHHRGMQDAKCMTKWVASYGAT
jgi:hypothetical protein